MSPLFEGVIRDAYQLKQDCDKKKNITNKFFFIRDAYQQKQDCDFNHGPDDQAEKSEMHTS